MENEFWAQATADALRNLWLGFLLFLPRLFWAIIVFVIGWFISIGIGKLVAEVLNRLKFDKFFEDAGLEAILQKAELKVSFSEFIGGIIKWIFIIVFLLAAVDILGLEEFAAFLSDILGYLPNVIIAILIFVVTVIVVDIVEKVVRTAVEGIKVGYGKAVSSIVKGAIWVFAIFAILRQLWIVPELIDIFFGALVYGIVAFFVISLGLAFGLGGQQVAAEILRDLKNRLQK
jgi:hypothetical protein